MKHGDAKVVVRGSDVRFVLAEADRGRKFLARFRAAILSEHHYAQVVVGQTEVGLLRCGAKKVVVGAIGSAGL